MIWIDAENHSDRLPREALLDRAYGPDRFLKPSQRLRNGRDPALALVARDGGEIVGTVQLWEVDAGGRAALLLGPLAVSPDRQGAGIGGRLMRAALNRAIAFGHGAVILVGDAPYYERFGFSTELTSGLAMPGSVDPARFLAVELRDGALAGAAGAVSVPTEPAMPVAAMEVEARLAA